MARKSFSESRWSSPSNAGSPGRQTDRAEDEDKSGPVHEVNARTPHRKNQLIDNDCFFKSPSPANSLGPECFSIGGVNVTEVPRPIVMPLETGDRRLGNCNYRISDLRLIFRTHTAEQR